MFNVVQIIGIPFRITLNQQAQIMNTSVLSYIRSCECYTAIISVNNMKLAVLLVVATLMAAAAAEINWVLRNAQARALALNSRFGNTNSTGCFRDSYCDGECSKTCLKTKGLCFQSVCYCKAN
ncbi:unnamed protein product [Chrysodeixis includens]|uniref:Uncharacterized protein n=1 Tax=Chrysodeixis includens TaxID=689277 RepID=A0A9N8KTK0_CHRIL|nr:unnamed protein product [Chrysodeixis includens]